MLIVRRGFAAVFDLVFVLSYLFGVSFAASTVGLASKDSPILYALDFAFPLLYFGCLDSARFGAGTIGKRLLGVEVRLASGDRTIPLYISLARTVLKLALPVLAFKLAGDVAFMPGLGFIGIACLLAAALVFPISVLFGKGAVGIHDKLMNTYVSQVSQRGISRNMVDRNWRIYWMWSVLSTAALVFPATAYLRSITGPKTPDIRTFLSQSDPDVELAKEIWLGKGSETIRPFVKQVTIMPSVAEFPTDYKDSYSKLPEETVKKLKGNRGAALIIVYLSKQGYSQHNLRSAVIDRVAQVAAPKLIGWNDLPTFIWLAFAVESDFGPVQLAQAEYGIMAARQQGSKPGQFVLVFAEPSHNRYVTLGFSISGIALSHDPF